MCVNYVMFFYFLCLHVLSAFLPATEGTSALWEMFTRETQGKGSVSNHVVTGEINGAILVETV